MRATRFLLQQRQPMIKFLGKRTAPSKIDHSPKPHPASPTHELPTTFASYRQQSQQHGPLGASQIFSSPAGGFGRSGASLGAVEPPKGTFFDRDDLPLRFHRTMLTTEEVEAVESGGASMWA